MKNYIQDAINWLKDMTNKGVELARNMKNKGVVLAQAVQGVPTDRPRSDGTTNVHFYLNDPTTPELVSVTPYPTQTRLSLRALGDMGGGWAPGTIQQQAVASLVTVNNALTYMASKSPRPVNGWAAVGTLTIMPRAGKDINAYYDRGSLRFFFFPDPWMKKVIYACDGRSVVTHEFGHAFLDILRPDFWNTQAPEIWALHEAFGDMTALLDGIRIDALAERALSETGGDLNKSNVLTKLAAEMGKGLWDYTQGKEGELRDALRDLTVRYEYTEPEKLPQQGRDDQIVNEPHSFSRILSGAFYEMIVRMYEQNKAAGMDPKTALQSAGDTAAHYLLNAVVGVPATVRIFNAMARQLMKVDESEGGKYQALMHQVFANRNLLSQQVMMMDDLTLGQVTKDLKEKFEVQVHGKSKVVRTLSTKEITLADHMGGVQAQEVNPLLGLKVEVPVQSTYYFDHQDKLVGMVNSHETEVFDAAFACLKYLNDKNLVGTHAKALFEVKQGKLVRKQIVCCCHH